MLLRKKKPKQVNVYWKKKSQQSFVHLFKLPRISPPALFIEMNRPPAHQHNLFSWLIKNISKGMALNVLNFTMDIIFMNIHKICKIIFIGIGKFYGKIVGADDSWSSFEKVRQRSYKFTSNLPEQKIIVNAMSVCCKLQENVVNQSFPDFLSTTREQVSQWILLAHNITNTL